MLVEVEKLRLERNWVKKFLRIISIIVSSGLQIETP